jgi:hypothetical protein
VARAQPAADRIAAAAPDWNVPQSITAQLAQIRADAEADRRPGPDVLRRINIGLLAVREFETSDPEFADVLIEIANRYEDWATGAGPRR